jgi:DUF971 family protein
MKSINLFRTELALLWEDGSETIVQYSTLRKLCPCAFCRGEKDVFGNQYGGVGAGENKEIVVVAFERVGLYGLQFFFSDGHKDGIYTFDFLKQLK